MSEFRDGLVVIEYTQDADSFGWSVLALVMANYKPDQPRYGVLDATLSTEFGQRQGRSQEQVIREAWNLVDWYPNEDAARDTYDEARSRTW